jgi:hypothetical protein
LHAHSAFSKCVSAVDGSPSEVLKFQRDTLGCGVLCLTEHVEYMSLPEFVHVLDCVEDQAGDSLIPLYGVEWAERPAHHTNFFATDRGVFDALRTILLVCDNLPDIYRRVRSELPPQSVVAIRHMHGMNQDAFGVSGARATETHDPDMEWAMEAMQTRGNMMVSDFRDLPLFPNNFLNAGARIGLVGGSDHSRGSGSNRFCLTGLWLSENTPAGVLKAIRERKTLAMSNGKIAIWVDCSGKRMGEEVAARGNVSIRCRLSAARRIRRVCLIRDGVALAWKSVDDTFADIELTDDEVETGTHWYCVTAEGNAWMNQPLVLAHSSPFFIDFK